MSKFLSNLKETNPEAYQEIAELIVHTMVMQSNRPFRFHAQYKPSDLKEIRKLKQTHTGKIKIANDLCYYLFGAVRCVKVLFGQPYSKQYLVSKRIIPKTLMNAVTELINDQTFMNAIKRAAKVYKIKIDIIKIDTKNNRPIIYFIVS
jgi:hypothetical protein